MSPKIQISRAGGAGVHGAEYHTGDVIPAADQDFGGYRLKGLKRMTTIPTADDIGTDGIVLAEIITGGGWDQYTKLMLHMNVTDGSTTFTDEIGKTVTANGNAQIDTAQSKFGGASGLFDGTGDYLSTPDSADWYFGTGDFTIDFWVRFNALPTTGDEAAIYAQRVDGTSQVFLEIYNNGGTYQWYLESDGGSAQIQIFKNAISLSTNTWYHVAVVRSGSSFYIFQDGTQCGTTYTSSASMADVAESLLIGKRAYGLFFNGWLDEFRVSKGIARWTSNFTPPTQEYAPDASYVRRLYANVNGTVIGFNADV
jgi:hypothetical protein